MDEASRDREDEWFRSNEKELIEAARVARAKREKERAEREAAEQCQRLRELHFMKCPKCGHDMKEQTFEGVAVDRCTFCEGVFFDAGELDRVLLKKEDGRRGFFRKLIGV